MKCSVALKLKGVLESRENISQTFPVQGSFEKSSSMKEKAAIQGQDTNMHALQPVLYSVGQPRVLQQRIKCL